MSEEKTFSQEEVNQIVEERIARAREKWQKESESSAETENLKAELAAKDAEISQIRREHYRAEARRAIVDELGAHGVTEEGRIERILRHVDLGEIEPSEDGNPYFGSVRRQLASVSKDMPELLKYELGAGSGGSSKPVLKQEKPLTREELESMSESEINSRWDQVKRFMAGERK
jgi:intergrase/recombinase